MQDAICAKGSWRRKVTSLVSFATRKLDSRRLFLRVSGYSMSTVSTLPTQHAGPFVIDSSVRRYGRAAWKTRKYEKVRIASTVDDPLYPLIQVQRRSLACC
jgi:hypothetical protein